MANFIFTKSSEPDSVVIDDGVAPVTISRMEILNRMAELIAESGYIDPVEYTEGMYICRAALRFMDEESK